MICINCKKEHNGNFCPNCGERSNVPQINFSSVVKETLASITNMDKGFLFNFKNLFKNPGSIVKDYINGKRKQIFNPISYLIISISAYLLIDALLNVKQNDLVLHTKLYDTGYIVGQFIKQYLKYFWILATIWLSLSTKLLFGKYNYLEHLIINSFVIGQATLIGLICFVIFRMNLLFNPIVYALIFWMTYQIFKTKKNDSDVFILTFGALFLFFVQLFIIVILISQAMKL